MNIFNQLNPDQFTRWDWSFLGLIALLVILAIYNSIRVSYYKRSRNSAWDMNETLQNDIRAVTHSRDYHERTSNRNKKLYDETLLLLNKKAAELDEYKRKEIATRIPTIKPSTDSEKKEKFNSHQKSNSRAGRQSPSNRIKPKE